MKRLDFNRALKAFLLIDRSDLEEAYGPGEKIADARWAKFNEDPYRYFLGMTQTDAARLWVTIEAKIEEGRTA